MFSILFPICICNHFGRHGTRAGESADFGRRRVWLDVADARRNLSGVCRRWYLVVLILHRFFIAVSRTVVNCDDSSGLTPHPLVWSAPSAASPYAVGPTGRPPQRSNPVNPTYRPNQRSPQQVAPTASVQKFPPLNQPTCRLVLQTQLRLVLFPRILAVYLDWLKNFLQQILSPEDYLKYKFSFERSPQKEEVPLALQLANKTQRTGQCLGADLNASEFWSVISRPNMRSTPRALTQLKERKYSLQRKIEELEALSAAAEAKQQSCSGGTFSPRSTARPPSKWSSRCLP